MMDTFYEENQENNIKMLKNKMTLDFNTPASHSKKAKLMKTCVLESPDLKMLKLASPELERMIIQQNGMVTTTPTPSSILPYFLKTEHEPTEEQELYARGFVDALNQLHQTNGQQNHNHCLTNNNNHNSNNNNNNIQSNSHLNSNSNQNTLNTSSDSSCDLTIADTNSNNKTNNRRNSYHILVPPPTSVSILTTTTGDTTDTKFAVPQIPSTHVPTTVSSVATSGVSGTEQYVSVSSCQTNGSHVLINPTLNSHNSVLPPYSQAVNDNNNNNNNTNNDCEKIERTYSAQPIDMEDQERIKLERKRLRNRIAASKCRRRKLERISKLEDKVKGLKGENSELSIVINKLRDQVCSLKQQVMEHVKCGCQLMVCQ